MCNQEPANKEWTSDFSGTGKRLDSTNADRTDTEKSKHEGFYLELFNQTATQSRQHIVGHTVNIHLAEFSKLKGHSVN